MSASPEFQVELKELAPVRLAGYRMRGRYDECGKGFALVCRAMARHAKGRPFILYHDADYKEQDADYETCVPVGPKAAPRDNIQIRELPAVTAVSLLHRGPYETLSQSCEKVFAYIQDHGLQARVPYREVYHKGPGMIFRGNPKKYITEIQIPVLEKNA